MGPVPHGLLAHPDPWRARVEPAPVVGDLHAGHAAVERQPHLDPARLRVAARVCERLLDYAHDLPAGSLGEGAREPFVHDQPQLEPPAGHAAVQVEEHLEGGDQRAAHNLVQAQLEDRAPQPLYRAPESLGHLVEDGGLAVLGGDLGYLYLLQRVDDVLEYVVVEVAGYAVALGLPRLRQP